MKTNGVDACPVIKGVNDDEVKELQQQQNGEQTTTTTQEEGAGGPLGSDSFDFDAEFVGEVPSIAAYKKMRKIMKLITGFYGKGTETKREQYESTFISE